MSFADKIKGIAVPEANGRDSESLPRLRWANGAKAARSNQPDTPGDFYAKSADFPTGLGAPWEADNRYPNDGGGYSATTLHIAVIAWRSQPFRDDRDPVTNKVIPNTRQYFMRWEKGMQIYTELLCLIAGYDGPAIWASDGLTGKAITGKGGILKTYEQGLLAQGEREAGVALPSWAFWLPIATKLHGDKIAFEDTGFGSFVTPPALHLPPDPLDALFVGDEILQRGAAVLKQYKTWAEQRRMPQGMLEGEVIHHPALPAPRNVPVAISALDDEI